MNLYSHFIEVADFGQIAAGKVVEFLPRQKKRWIAVPRNQHRFQQFITYTVCGESLLNRGIHDGDVVICRTRFEFSEIKEETVCVLLIRNSELTIKMVTFNPDKTVHVRSANPAFPDLLYSADEVEVIAIVCELQRKV